MGNVEADDFCVCSCERVTTNKRPWKGVYGQLLYPTVESRTVLCGISIPASAKNSFYAKEAGILR